MAQHSVDDLGINRLVFVSTRNVRNPSSLATMGEQVHFGPFLSWEKHAMLALSFVSELPPLLSPAGRQAAYH